MKNFFKYILWFLLGILIPIIIYVTAAIILSIASTNPMVIICDDKKDIYIASNGIHLEIIYPYDLIDSHYLKELNIPVHVKYVAFGWGDKAFYLETPTWNDLKLSVALKAAFLKSETAMHVTHHYSKINAWQHMNLCTEQYIPLINCVMRSFERNEEGHIIEIKNAGYTHHDRFYKANGNYTFVKTCNNWVNIGLQKSNIKTSIWSPFDYGVLYHARKKSTEN